MRTFSLLFLLLTLAATVIATAEETTPATSAETTITASPLLPTAYRLGLSGAILDIDGNAAYAQRYVTPPEGLYLSSVGLINRQGDGSILDMSLADLGQPTFAGNLWLVGTPRSLAVNASERRTAFYADPTATTATSYRNVMSDTALHLGPGTVRVTANATRLTGTDAFRYTQPGISYLAPLGSGRVGLGYSHPTFTFDNGGPLDGADEVFALTYTPLVTDRTAVEANAAMTRTTLDDRSLLTPRATTVDVHATHELTPVLTLDGTFTHDQVSDVITRNGYVQRSTGAQVTAGYTGVARTLIEVGGGRQMVSYVNDPHTLLVKSPVNNLTARVETRLSSTLRMKAAAEHLWTTNRPEAFDLTNTGTGVSRLWSRRDDQRLELSYSPGARWGGSAGLRRYVWANTDQDTKSATISRDVNAWWIPTNRATLYATYLSQGFNLDGIALGDSYTTDGETWVTGLSLQISPKVALESSYTLVNATGAEDADQHILGLGVSYHGAHNTEFSLRTAFDTNTGNSDPSRSYDTDWTELRVGKTF
jgi:hypothetical protein